MIQQMKTGRQRTQSWFNGRSARYMAFAGRRVLIVRGNRQRNMRVELVNGRICWSKLLPKPPTPKRQLTWFHDEVSGVTLNG